MSAGKKLRLIACIILLLALYPVSGYAEGGACAKDKRVVDPCYNMHARLLYHANMRPYLHPGNGRWIGIVEKSTATDTDYFWPPEIEKILAFDMDVVGDFRVCPFTHDKPKK